MVVVGTRRVVGAKRALASRWMDRCLPGSGGSRRSGRSSPPVEAIRRIAGECVDPRGWKLLEWIRPGARRCTDFLVRFGDRLRQGAGTAAAMQGRRPTEVDVAFRSRDRSGRDPPACRRRGDRIRIARLAQQNQQRRLAGRLDTLGREMQPSRERHAEAASIGHHRCHPAASHRLLDRPRPGLGVAARRIEAPRGLEQSPIERLLEPPMRTRRVV